MNKQKILDLFIVALQQEADVLVRAALTAKTAATEVEAKPENKYDTRGLEQSYLADGQSKRVLELQKSIHYFKNIHLQNFDSSSLIDVTALVQLEGEDGDRKFYFLLPDRGGMKIQFEGREILSLSPDSPLATLLIGKKSGESFEFKVAGQLKSFQILSVC